MTTRSLLTSLVLLTMPLPVMAQDPAAGEQAFRACQACHTIEEGEPHRVGPNLHDVFGQPAGTREGYSYSPAMQDTDIVWNEETLDPYLESPQQFLPGTKMVYPGIRDPQQRQDVIAYLKANSSAAGQ